MYQTGWDQRLTRGARPPRPCARPSLARRAGLPAQHAEVPLAPHRSLARAYRASGFACAPVLKVRKRRRAAGAFAAAPRRARDGW